MERGNITHWKSKHFQQTILVTWWRYDRCWLINDLFDLAWNQIKFMFCPSSPFSNFQQEVLWCLYEESHACSSRRMHQVLCAWIYIDIAWCWLHLLGTRPAVIAQLTPAKTTRAWMGYDVYCAPLTIMSVLSLSIIRLFVSITWWSSMKDCSLPEITQYLSFLWEFNHTVRVKPCSFPITCKFSKPNDPNVTLFECLWRLKRLINLSISFLASSLL